MLLATTASNPMNYVSVKVKIDDNVKCINGKTVGEYTVTTKENLRRFQHVPITFYIIYEGYSSKHHSQTVLPFLPKSKSGKSKKYNLPTLDCTAPYPVKHVVIKSDRGGKKSFQPTTVYDINYWHNMQRYGWEYRGNYFCKKLGRLDQCIWFSWNTKNW